MYQPAFDRPSPISNRGFYERLGRVHDSVDLAEKDELFHDWIHLNTTGALILSDRVADELWKMLP